MLRLMEEQAGTGQLEGRDTALQVRYQIARYPGFLRVGPAGARRVQAGGAPLDLSPAPDPAALVGADLTLRLEDGRPAADHRGRPLGPRALGRGTAPAAVSAAEELEHFGVHGRRDMPTDRTLLLISTVLQGAISVTFSLAFFGLGRRRPAPGCRAALRRRRGGSMPSASRSRPSQWRSVRSAPTPTHLPRCRSSSRCSRSARPPTRCSDTPAHPACAHVLRSQPPIVYGDRTCWCGWTFGPCTGHVRPPPSWGSWPRA